MISLEAQPMSDAPQTAADSSNLNVWHWMIMALSLLVVLFFVLAPTSFPLSKLDTVAYAVCHRIPERSLLFGGQQLPLCARCSGTFLGVFLTFATLTAAGRTRASLLPPGRVLVVLLSFILVWALDGINSYLTLYPNGPHVYEPQNWLRLTTGMLNGLALGTLVFAVLQFSLWRAPRSEPVIRNIGELTGLVILAVLLIVLVLSKNPHLLYPVSVASTLGVLVMLTSANTVVVLVAAGRENNAWRWRDTIWPALVAVALSLTIVMGIGAGRNALSNALNLSF
jgi:uncharacterized membrane protein